MALPGHDRENDAVMKVPAMRFAAALAVLSLLFGTGGDTAVAAGGAGAETRQAAESLSQKLAAITQNAAAAKPVRPHNVTLTENELNSWFLFRSSRYLPAGVSRPSVNLLGDGAVRGTATVDLERLAARRGSTNPFDPLALLGGRVPVTVTGTLHTKAGIGQFDVQSTDVSGIPVPKFILQQLLSYYATTPDSPEGIHIDDSFTLPANIQRIDVGRGQMVVVQ
jgi:hypothetical protein